MINLYKLVIISLFICFTLRSRTAALKSQWNMRSSVYLRAQANHSYACACATLFNQLLQPKPIIFLWFSFCVPVSYFRFYRNNSFIVSEKEREKEISPADEHEYRLCLRVYFYCIGLHEPNQSRNRTEYIRHKYLECVLRLNQCDDFECVGGQIDLMHRSSINIPVSNSEDTCN